MQDNVKYLQDEIEKLSKQLNEKNREIEVEKALEQLRLKAMQMRASSELSGTSAVLFDQLKELKINAIRSGVGIFDDDNNAVELWVTSIAEDGKIFFILDYVNIHIHPVFEKILEARQANLPFAFTKLEGKSLLNYYTTMSTYLTVPFKKENNQAEYFYSFFFTEGSLNVITKQELTEEEKNILFRLTNVFGLLYTRFLDLQKAERQASLIEEEKIRLEQTLQELKATQSQLIQSEKMASLGELTAGIAHEIQNPLNFVNNFSEVNLELLNEMEDAILKSDREEIRSISEDLKQNLQKIHHHGKRADGIVKGMLQHSRSSSSQKEPTDINALAEEYLRLAYHGLRAKDKTFNATMYTEFDKSIGDVNIVPQDIGRVILNLITNAFYAVNEKKTLRQAQGESYDPTVTVKTFKNPPPTGGGRGPEVLISIKDNGNGIPPSVKDKIFQPFFTTKPTGQGTGLGLSMSYDIIKAHGGTMEVDSKEGEFTEFIIKLPDGNYENLDMN